MRIALIADLHANLPALRAVLDDTARIGCDAVWCAGDLVGRGPHPDEVVELIREREIPTVQGNWDEAVAMGRAVTGSLWASSDAERLGQQSLAWTTGRLSEENLAWLRQLPTNLRLLVEGRNAQLFHGSPLKPSEYLWEERPSRHFARIATDEGDELFCFGHSHETFHRVSGEAHFVAGGSVGCGGVGDANARYAVIYVTEADLVVGFRSIAYERADVLRDLAAAGLSADLLGSHPVPHPTGDAAPVPSETEEDVAQTG